MVINTFFDATDIVPGQGEIIRLWRDSWQSRGWEPRILNPRTFAYDPRRKIFLERAKRDATSQKSYYRLTRWLALAAAGGGWMCEYDVINFDLRTPMVSVSSKSFSPFNALAHLDKAAADKVVDAFIGFERPIHDDTLLFAIALIYSDVWPDIHANYGDGRAWEIAKTVHFGSTEIEKVHGACLEKHRVVDACGRSV